MMLAGSCPAISDRSDLLSVARAITLTTESLGNPVVSAGRNTVPGMTARPVLDVISAVSTVTRRLSLYGSDCITNTGRRFAGRLPATVPRSAQQIWDLRITTRLPRIPTGGDRQSLHP